jgi:hypothetical protein
MIKKKKLKLHNKPYSSGETIRLFLYLKNSYIYVKIIMFLDDVKDRLGTGRSFMIFAKVLF